MVYKAVESEMGPYKATDGSLYDIMEAVNVMTPQGKNVGWTEYENIDKAAAAFNLTYIGPQDNDTESLSNMIKQILKEEVNN